MIYWSNKIRLRIIVVLSLVNHCALEVHSLGHDWSRSGFLHIECIFASLTFEVMFNVFLYHLCGHITGGADKVPAGPEVLTPVAFFEFGVFHLEFSGCFTFEIFDQFWDWCTRVYGDEDMNMIWCNGATQYLNVFFVTDSADKFFCSLSDVSFQDFETILSDPTYVYIDRE